MHHCTVRNCPTLVHNFMFGRRSRSNRITEQTAARALQQFPPLVFAASLGPSVRPSGFLCAFRESTRVAAAGHTYFVAGGRGRGRECCCAVSSRPRGSKDRERNSAHSVIHKLRPKVATDLRYQCPLLGTLNLSCDTACKCRPS